MELACHSPTVIVCRCSPTQKADIVHLIKRHTKKLVCSIGRFDIACPHPLYKVRYCVYIHIDAMLYLDYHRRCAASCYDMPIIAAMLAMSLVQNSILPV